MKIKKDFIIKTIGEDIVVVPVKDQAVRFNGIITLNNTGKFLFDLLQKEDLEKEEIVQILLDKYDVEEELAVSDIDMFINKCKENGLLDEESL
ncbi:MAG: PqqD family protein [Candidatus Izemoplasmatales bacterium]